jgi:hypothetical protein
MNIILFILTTKLWSKQLFYINIINFTLYLDNNTLNFNLIGYDTDLDNKNQKLSIATKTIKYEISNID